MKKIYCLFLISNLLVSCKFSTTDSKQVYMVNHFDSKEKNIQICEDILGYDYYSVLLNKISNISRTDLENDLVWGNLTTDNSKSVSIQIQINKRSKLLESKDSIYLIMEEEIKKHIKNHITREKQFDEAVEKAEMVLKLIDDRLIDDFITNASEIFLAHTNKDDLKNLLKDIDKLGHLESREYKTKQFYQKFENVPEGEYFIVRFISNYENADLVKESITLELNDDTWKIVSFNINS